MRELIIFIAGLVIGGAFVLAVKKKSVDLTVVNKQRAEQKERNKQKALQLFQTKAQITNDDVETALKVSDATAERYLDELEKEGRLKQIGKTGKNVLYRKR